MIKKKSETTKFILICALFYASMLLVELVTNEIHIH